MPFCNFIKNLSQALSKCLSNWIKVNKQDYFTNTSQEFRNYFCLGFLWISRKTGWQNWRGPIFLRFNLVKYQCAATSTTTRFQAGSKFIWCHPFVQISLFAAFLQEIHLFGKKKLQNYFFFLPFYVHLGFMVQIRGHKILFCIKDFAFYMYMFAPLN